MSLWNKNNNSIYGRNAGPVQYCKRCGRPVLFCATTEDGTPNNTLEEEITIGVCHKCYAMEAKRLEEEAMKIVVELEKEEKAVADTKYEEAIKKLMEELNKKNGNNA